MTRFRICLCVTGALVKKKYTNSKEITKNEKYNTDSKTTERKAAEENNICCILTNYLFHSLGTVHTSILIYLGKCAALVFPNFFLDPTA